MQKDPAGNKAPAGGFKVGGWYSGYQYNGTGFSQAAGVESIGTNAGKEAPTFSASDASYIQQQRISAQNIQSPVNVSLPSTTATSDFVGGLSAEVSAARQAYLNEINAQKGAIDTQASSLRAKEQNILTNDIQPLTTPFRQDIETQQRETLGINKNFQANQTLIDELDSLLTQGNDLIRQQQEVTGLAAVRNPRIQKTMDDITARAGIIQAVISARNGQISVAENMIDRTIDAIAADRQDQISYYQTVLELNRQDIVKLDAQSQKLAEEQLDLKRSDLENAQKTADYVKQLMLDPNTAQILADGGVKLTDTIEQINQKVANVTYAREVSSLSNEMVAKGAEVILSTKGIPKDELRVLTDSRGNKHYYRVPKDTTTGTATERSVSKTSSTITQNKLNFPDAVWNFANQMSLSDIYSAYAQSAMGQQYGLPVENPAEVAALYKVAKGEISQAEYEAQFPGK